MSKTTWNYRVVTTYHHVQHIRAFSIAECYYSDGVLDSYSSKENMYYYESVEDIINTHAKIAEAFAKPIIDLDNFPNEWHEPKTSPLKR